MKRIFTKIYHKIFYFPSLRYSYVHNYLVNSFSYTDRERMLDRAMRYTKVSKVEGDYLEFGVWKGDTLAKAYHIANKNNHKKLRFFAFDSFEGLPEPKGIDKIGGEFYQGQYKCGKKKFISNLKKWKVNLKRISIVKGWFDQSLPEHRKNGNLKKVAIAWIDCDIYESTVPVLEYLTEIVQDGTILVFDDWYNYKGDSNLGEQKAVNEWLKKNKKIKLTPYFNYSAFGHSFIVNIKK